MSQQESYLKHDLVVTSEIIQRGLTAPAVFHLVFEKVRKAIPDLFPDGPMSRGLLDIVYSGNNRFRSGVIALIGDLTDLEPSSTILLCAIAEYSWASILVFDDISDNEQLRRGYPALWRTAGLLSALQSAVAASFESLLRLMELEGTTQSLKYASQSFAFMMVETARGQLEADGLGFHSSYDHYFGSMLAKTYPLRWAVNCAGTCNKLFTQKILVSLEKLGIAATLKNDLEDLFPPHPEYEQQGIDILAGQVTYPIRVLYDCCDANDKVQLEQLFKDRQHEPEDRLVGTLLLLQRYPNVLHFCHESLLNYVGQSLLLLDEAILELPETYRNSEHVNLLRDWMKSYAAG